jgi:hypothetical protein
VRGGPFLKRHVITLSLERQSFTTQERQSFTTHKNMVIIEIFFNG